MKKKPSLFSLVCSSHNACLLVNILCVFLTHTKMLVYQLECFSDAFLINHQICVSFFFFFFSTNGIILFGIDGGKSII